MADLEKKTYSLPKKLAAAFTEWCKPGRDFSPKVAGAALLWMTIDPVVRAKIVGLAYSDNIKQATTEVRELFINNIVASLRTPSTSLKICTHQESRILDLLRELHGDDLDQILKDDAAAFEGPAGTAALEAVKQIRESSVAARLRNSIALDIYEHELIDAVAARRDESAAALASKGRKHKPRRRTSKRA